MPHPLKWPSQASLGAFPFAVWKNWGGGFMNPLPRGKNTVKRNSERRISRESSENRRLFTGANLVVRPASGLYETKRTRLFSWRQTKGQSVWVCTKHLDESWMCNHKVWTADLEASKPKTSQLHHYNMCHLKQFVSINLSFFPFLLKTQANHLSKRMVNIRLTT